MIEITERDLFGFVFHKDSLSGDKAKYIENTNLFDDEINFLLSLKEKLSEDLTNESREKIVRKIEAYRFLPAPDNDSSLKKTKREKKSEI